MKPFLRSALQGSLAAVAMLCSAASVHADTPKDTLVMALAVDQDIDQARWRRVIDRAGAPNQPAPARWPFRWRMLVRHGMGPSCSCRTATGSVGFSVVQKFAVV